MQEHPKLWLSWGRGVSILRKNSARLGGRSQVCVEKKKGGGHLERLVSDQRLRKY